MDEPRDEVAAAHCKRWSPAVPLQGAAHDRIAISVGRSHLPTGWIEVGFEPAITRRSVMKSGDLMSVDPTL